MKKGIYYLLFFSFLYSYSQTDTGNLENYLNSKIEAMPDENGNEYSAPSANDLIIWTNCINAILANDITTARAEAANVNYKIVEYTDSAIGNNDVFYVIEEEAIQSKYWGTFVFAKNADRPNLVLQAPHSDFDFNTGKQTIYSFVRLNNKALFLNGTHRCNHNSFSTCAGTTKVCNEEGDNVSKAYRISDMAHSTASVWQKTTEIIYNTINTSVFFQIHGFEKQDTDPDVILGNGTNKTPNVDYATQLKTALKAEDNSLTFKIGHLDDWSRLLGTTNTQGRLINQSNNPCNQSPQNTTGRFLHIEQEKDKLRQDNTGWEKMHQALKNIFTIPTSTWLGNTSDWHTANNWSSNNIPLTTDNLVIPDIANQPEISTNAVANNITIDKNAAIHIQNGGSLLIDGFATVNGSLIYNLTINDDKWHLISSPVKNAKYGDTWNTENNIDTNLPNEAVAKYINTNGANGDWSYYQNGAEALDFEDGIGYSLKRTIAGDYNFEGTLAATPVITAIKANNIGNPNLENRWNLIGNPFPAYLNINTFLDINAASLKDTHESIYVWNANAGETGNYQSLTTGYIHPGQGFFVNSDVDSTSVSFTKEMQSSQNGITLYRSSKPKITLLVSNDKETKSTEINFSDHKTLGLDPGFDVGTFTGQSSNFSLYTHLVFGDNGVDFIKQSLPTSALGNTIIPIGIYAKANEEIKFNAINSNLPTEIKVFLEDRLTKKITDLNEKSSTYTIKLIDDLNGIGRFYLHTSQKALNIQSAFLRNINIYKVDPTAIKIVGLEGIKTNMNLFSTVGKKIMNMTFISRESKNIILPKLASGIYFITLQTNNRKIKRKIVLD